MIISALSQKLYLTLHGSYKSTTYFSYSYLSHNYSGNGLNKLQWIRIRKVELVRVFLQLFFTFETHSIFFFFKKEAVVEIVAYFCCFWPTWPSFPLKSHIHFLSCLLFLACICITYMYNVYLTALVCTAKIWIIYLQPKRSAPRKNYSCLQ